MANGAKSKKGDDRCINAQFHKCPSLFQCLVLAPFLPRNEPNFSLLSAALIFLWLLSLHQGKESNMKQGDSGKCGAGKAYAEWSLCVKTSRQDAKSGNYVVNACGKKIPHVGDASQPLRLLARLPSKFVAVNGIE